MPVLLSREEIPRWLDNAGAVGGNDPLFASRLKFPLLLHPLPRSVGNASNKDPAAMAGLGEAVLLEPG